MHSIEQLLVEHISTFSLGKIKQIEKVTNGLSKQCFKLTLDDNGECSDFIAKVYADGNVERSTELLTYKALKHHEEAHEINGELNSQVNRKLASHAGVSSSTLNTPKLIAYSTHVILLESMQGELLSSFLFPKNHKISLAITTMSILHQLPKDQFSFAEVIDFSSLFTELLSKTTLTSKQGELVNAKIAIHLKAITDFYGDSKASYAICHGDINFANIIVELDEHETCLIDFESLCAMPVEYDIAMMLAVNELGFEYSGKALATYMMARKAQVILHSELIEHYYYLSLLINGLWYLAKFQAYVEASHCLTDSNAIAENELLQTQFKEKASKQFALLDAKFKLIC